MYVEMGYIYSVLFLLLLLGYLLWKNERKITKLEMVVSLLNQHGHSTDTILRSILDAMDSLLKDLIRVTKDIADNTQNKKDDEE